MNYQLWLLTKPVFLKEKGIATVRALMHGGAPVPPAAQGLFPTLPPAQPSLTMLLSWYLGCVCWAGAHPQHFPISLRLMHSLQ